MAANYNLKYVDKTRFIAGVPASDLTEEDFTSGRCGGYTVAQLVATGCYAVVEPKETEPKETKPAVDVADTTPPKEAK